MGKRLSIALALLPLALAPGLAGASSARDGGATSQAYALKVIVPGQGGAATTMVSAPADGVSFGNAGAYPSSDVISWGASVASASASPGQTSTASASAELSSLSLFGGEVQASSIRGAVQAKASAAEGASGGFAESRVGSLVVNGQAVSVAAGARVALGDWGTAIVLAQGASPASASYRGNVTALDIRLNAEHGGLPAGTQILVGYAEAAVTAPSPPPPPPKPKPAAPRPAGSKPPKLDPPEAGAIPPLVREPPSGIQPRLTPSRYVFPVYGHATFTNTFRAPRATTSWHHGEDIFAALGAPILAVTDGTLFSVGWNDVGGYRLWLLDGQGNQFYYAHLSAFSPLAVENARVKAGDVIGFMGNSGDAAGTPYHLHFEIHPVGMLHLGYDGVVSPYPYLVKWRRLQDVVFPDGAGWAPAPTADATAPKPGAIVLQVSDISSASGLRPGSVARAFVAPAAAEGDGALVRAFAPPPARGDAREGAPAPDG